MKDESSLKNLKIDEEKLLSLGFEKTSNAYEYKTKIMNNQFELLISIDKNNIINSKVIEIESNEEYMIYNVESSTGNFVGQMREEYDKILNEIKVKCCLKSVFKSEYANLIISHEQETLDNN